MPIRRCLWLATVRGWICRLVVWPWLLRTGAHTRWSRSFPIRNRRSPSTKELVLGSEVLLLGLESRRPRLDQSILNRSNDIRSEDRSCFYAAWDRLFPCLQHLVHLPSSVIVYRRIRLHKCLIQLPTKEQGVRRADILNNGVENIECW